MNENHENNEYNGQNEFEPDAASNQEVIPKIKKRKKKLKKQDLSKNKKKKGIHLGIGILMLMLFCSFLLVVATFLQINVSHLIVPFKLFSGNPLQVEDWIFTIKYIPQIPVVLFIVGLLGRKYGFLSILLYILLGLFIFPVFALGGGLHYVTEYSFGYILAYLPAAVLVGTILKKDYSYINVLKAVAAGVLLIHLSGIIYMTVFAYIRHAGIDFVTSWIEAQSGLKILYDIVFSYLAILLSKYARIILWFYL